MNYAEDRLDRRARHNSTQLMSSGSKDPLWIDFCRAALHGSRRTDHELLARTLRDAGWNRHAIYHYGCAWIEQKKMNEPPRDRSAVMAMADYAQMVELAGFPDVAVVAVFVHASHGALKDSMGASAAADDGGGRGGFADKEEKGRFPRDPTWLQQGAERPRDCGCGGIECGQSPCFLPWKPCAGAIVVENLASYCAGRLQLLYQHQQQQQNRGDNTGSSSSSPTQIPTANEILRQIAENEIVCDLSESVVPSIPPLLRFWQGRGDVRPLPQLVQLLAIKLLYQVLPSMAMEAIVYSPGITEQTEALYKSHWAYYVFLRSLVLGPERIKLHRRNHLPYCQVPLWEQLWGLYPQDKNHDLKAVVCKDRSPAQQGEFARHLQWLLQFLERTDTPTNAGDDKVDYIAYALPILDHCVGRKPIYIVGDSHVLSLAWQSLRLAHTNAPRLVVPVVVTGLKAWHVRQETRFFTQTCLQTALRRLPTETQTILISAGEIDCREGMGGPLLQGYTEACLNHVRATAQEYVKALSVLLDQHHLRQILVMPVAPHLHRKTGRKAGHASRRETMRVWNAELKALLPLNNGIFFLDYYEHVRDETQDAYVLNRVFNADATHMNGSFAPLLEDAIISCGCNLNLV
jgi:hypothetical protein